MKKFKYLLFVCGLILLCGCSSVKKIEEDDLIHYHLGNDAGALYGGYNIVKTWNGFKLVDYSLTKDPNEIFSNDEISILRESGSKYTYTYKDKSKTTVFYNCPTTPKLFVDPEFAMPFEMNNQVYFFYYDIYDLVVNTLEDGELVEYERIPLKEDDYEFRNFLYNEYEMYSIYKNEDTMKFTFDEKDFFFNVNDEVIVLKDYIFYSTYEDNQVTGSYIINRKTNETIQLENSVDFHFAPNEQESADYYFDKSKNNSFIFVEKVENQNIYYYGTIEDNMFKKIELPYPYYENDRISLYDEKTILLSQNPVDSWNQDHYVIEIK